MSLPLGEAPLSVREPWKARIERSGWGYDVHLSSGIMAENLPHHAWTAKGAIRKARRLVAKRNAEETRRTWTLTE